MSEQPSENKQNLATLATEQTEQTERMHVDLNNPILNIKPEAVKEVEKSMRRAYRHGASNTPDMRYAGASEWSVQQDGKKDNISQQGFQSVNLGNFKNANPLHQSDEGFKSFTDKLHAEQEKERLEAQAIIDAELADNVDEAEETPNDEVASKDVEPEPSVPPPPSISEEMLQTLHDSAYTKGFHDGREVAIQSFEQEKETLRQELYEDLYANDSNDLLHKLGRNIYQHVEVVKDTERDRDVHLLTLMLEIFRKIVPGMVKKYGTLEIEHFLKEIISKRMMMRVKGK